MSTKNENEQQTAAPAPRPAALDNLERLAAEADAADQAVAQAVQIDQVQQQESTLTDQEREKAALAGAAMAVSFAETVLKMGIPYASVDKEAKELLEVRLAAVLKKNGGEPPAWFVKVREEAELCFSLGGIGFGVWMQVQQHKQQVQQQQAQQHQQHNQRQDAAPAAQPPRQPVRPAASVDSLDPNAPPLAA